MLNGLGWLSVSLSACKYFIRLHVFENTLKVLCSYTFYYSDVRWLGYMASRSGGSFYGLLWYGTARSLNILGSYMEDSHRRYSEDIHGIYKQSFEKQSCEVHFKIRDFILYSGTFLVALLAWNF